MPTPKGPVTTFEAISETPSRPTISIDGVDTDADVAQLLEDLAQHIKASVQTGNSLTGKDVVFKRISTGQLFDVVHRS